MTLDEFGADSFHFATQRLLMWFGRDLCDRALQRDHIRTAAIAMRLNQLQLGFADDRLDRIAMRIDPERCDRRDEVLERFEEVDVRIPQRIIRIEDQIQRRFIAPGGCNRHAPRSYPCGRARVNQVRCAIGSTTSAPLDGLRPT